MAIDQFLPSFFIDCCPLNLETLGITCHCGRDLATQGAPPLGTQGARNPSVLRSPIGVQKLDNWSYTYKVGPPSYKMVYKPHEY